MQGPQVGDEEGFLNYEEKVIYDLQRALRNKKDMSGFPLIGLCEQLDSLIYSDALKEYNLSMTANVWSRRECILYYQDKTDLLIRNIELKELNWKKLYEDYRSNARHILQTILKGDSDRRSKGSDAYKSASRALMPKARRSAVGFSVRDDDPVRRKSVGKPRGPKGSKVVKAAPGLPSSPSFGANLGEFVEGGTFNSNDALEGANDADIPPSAEADLLGEGELGGFGFDFSENPEEGDTLWM
jgi:hypothetical protein